ncbi:hypothetical protein ACA910_006384 [Epithemia clementina (nom. ined.)]
MEDTLSVFDYKLPLLKTLVGKHSDAQGTLSVLELLDELASQVAGATVRPPAVQFFTPPTLLQDTTEFKNLESVIAALKKDHKHFQSMIMGLVHAEINSSFQSNLFNPTSLFQIHVEITWGSLLVVFRPTYTIISIGFLQAWSSDPAVPGDKLSAALQQVRVCLQHIEQELSAIRNGSGSSTSSGTTRHPFGSTSGCPTLFGWGGAGHTSASIGSTSPMEATLVLMAPMSQAQNDPKFAAEVQESLRLLSESINAIWDQLETDLVDMGKER